MIVGKSDISVDELITHISSVEEFCKYSDSLIPEIFRSVTGIVGNQRYLCCLVIRNSNKVSWDTKKKVLPLFFSKSKLCGYVDCIIEAYDLLDMSSKQKIVQYGEMEGNIYKQSAISNAVTKWYEYYRGLGCTVCCYAEDMLAVELLYDKEVKWYTVLGSADRLFLQDNVTSYPEAYKKIQKNSIDTKIIRKSIIKYASKTLEQCVDMEMYLASNFNTLINRIRLAASDNLDVNAKAIVYVDTAVANRFCNLPKNVVGNGKSIVHVQVENNIELFSFGGIEMNHDSFIDVERCLYGSNV